jgi:DNA repair protein RadC
MTRYPTRIKEWPAEDRPREKLLDKGPQALTDTELLAIILALATQAQARVPSITPPPAEPIWGLERN